MKHATASQSDSPPVFVVYNNDQLTEDDDEPPLVSDTSVVDVAYGVESALRARGRRCSLLELDDSTEPLEKVARQFPNAVYFNLVESLGRDSRREPEVPKLLRRLGVSFTGSGAAALALALDKLRARSVLARAKVPTPRGGVVRSGAAAVALAKKDRLVFPLFTKPACADGSIGVSQQSLVHDPAQLNAQVRRLIQANLGPVVVEEYLPGDECSVAMCPGRFGPMFAVGVIDFSACPNGLVPIVTYDCKWNPESPEYAAQSIPASERLSKDAISTVVRLARRTLAAIGANGPARVDLRFDARGKPHVIDINPNPDLDPDAGFARSFRAMGVEYEEMLGAIVDDAVRRRQPALQPHRGGSRIAGVDPGDELSR